MVRVHAIHEGRGEDGAGGSGHVLVNYDRESSVVMAGLSLGPRGSGAVNTVAANIKHMRITDRGNEVSSDSPPDRGRDTMMMMLVIVKRTMSGGTLGGQGVGTQRYFEYVWHPVSHWGSSSSERPKIFGAKIFLVYIVHSVFDHKDPQKNGLDCCRLKRTWCV